MGVAKITQSSRYFSIATDSDGVSSSSVVWYTYYGVFSQIQDVFNSTIIFGNIMTDVEAITKSGSSERFILGSSLSISDDEFASGLNSIFTFEGSFRVTIYLRVFSRSGSGDYTVKEAHLTCNDGVVSWTFSPGTLSSGSYILRNSSGVVDFYCQVILDTLQPL